jgi:hypothetical protein
VDVTAVAKRLYRGCVQQFDLAGNGAVLEQEQMSDSARGSGAHNLLCVRLSVAGSDLLVEPREGTARQTGGHRPDQLQGLPIHFVLAKMSG